MSKEDGAFKHVVIEQIIKVGENIKRDLIRENEEVIWRASMIRVSGNQNLPLGVLSG
jgi:hypothetical protein